MEPFLVGDQVVIWWQIGYTEPPSITEEAPTVFTGIDTHSEYAFAFHACKASASTTMWTHRMPDSSPWYPTQYCFQQTNSV